MAEIGRFGVFLPSYIWEGDGPERARGIKAFAQHGRGPGLRFDLRHRPPDRRQALLFGLVPRAARRARGRGRGHESRAPGYVDPDHAAAQPGDAGQGAGHAPVPVREPHDPGRRRGLERARVRCAGRQEVGTRQAHGRDARHHDPAARGRDRHLPRSTSTRSTTCSSSRISAQRPEIWIGGGSQLADPKSPDLPKFVESVKARVMRTDGWIPRPTCPPDEIARDWRELQDYYREHGRDPRECVVAHENFMHLVLTERSG